MIGLPDNSFDMNSLRLAGGADAKRSELGQSDFLTLMIAQFRNQDPLKPTDSGEFIGQMAQFSTVSGITEMNASMKSLAESLYSSQALQAATIVGREVLAAGDTAALGEGKPLKGGIELPLPSNDAFVRIYDNSGQLVRELDLGPRNAGFSPFEWDGTRRDGTMAPPGNYRVRAGMTAADGREQGVDTYVATPVVSVSLDGGGGAARIHTAGGGEIGLSGVKAIM